MKRDEGLLLGVLLLSALPSAPCFSTGGVLLRSPAFIMQMQQQDAQNPSRTALAVTRRVLLQGAAAFALTTGSVANAQPQVGWGEPKNRRVPFSHHLCSVPPRKAFAHLVPLALISDLWPTHDLPRHQDRLG